METRRWVNHMHPQTLQIAVLLCYFDAVFNVLFGFVFVAIGAVITIGEVVAGVGIANDKKAGYWVGVGISGLWLVWLLLNGGDILSVLFAVARLALLLHPQSRDYQRIWFK